MNDAHLHMLVNHFPIIGTIFGLGILAAGITTKNNAIKNVAYALFIVAAIFTFASMSTGEGAEELVENMPDVGHHIIHEHEEKAETFALFAYMLGAISIVGLFANSKNHSKAKIISFLILLMSIVAVILAKSVGTSGGEVRHTEIRENAPQNAPNEHEDDH